MKIPLTAGIALRYLRAKKSHSAVTAISVVSICGIAVATAAIICVLSVFNGFKAVISDRLDTLSPTVMITPTHGKTIANPDSISTELRKISGVATVTPTILENALAIANGREVPVSIKGVNIQEYASVTALQSLLLSDSLAPAPTLPELIDSFSYESSGNQEEEDPEPGAIFSIGAASSLGVYPGDKVLLFTPRREGSISLSNPSASFLTDSVRVMAVYQTNQSDFDDDRIITDLNLARDLLQYDWESSALEISLKPSANSQSTIQIIRNSLGKNYVVKDRLQQQETNFRMISIEKWITFLILFFILLIASFNIISSLSMLVLEKQGSISTLRALGMTRRNIGKIFWWESMAVTFIGGIAGLVIGILLCLLQENFGLIRLQGNPSDLLIQAYPVRLEWPDIFITLIPIFLIGLMAATITSIFARSRAPK